jgi:hypothetical protein
MHCTPNLSAAALRVFPEIIRVEVAEFTESIEHLDQPGRSISPDAHQFVSLFVSKIHGPPKRLAKGKLRAVTNVLAPV